MSKIRTVTCELINRIALVLEKGAAVVLEKAMFLKNCVENSDLKVKELFR